MTGNKYLIVQSGDERVGMPIACVRRIIEYHQPQFVPAMPANVLGVLNMGADSVPIVDLRQRLGLGISDVSPRSGIVILELNTAGQPDFAGILVDSVSHVALLANEDLNPMPHLSSHGIRTIGGFVSAQERAVLLDPSLLLDAGSDALAEFYEASTDVA